MSGVQVKKAVKGRAAARAGVRKGDLLVSINGHIIRDAIDYLFYKSEPPTEMVFIRGNGKDFRVEAEEDPGLELEHFRVRTCGNNCVFCFVSQLPRGMRKPLYVKDEDYRMSFLYGNYVTLCNLKPEDRQRIAGQRLGPLYISVHTTDNALRRRMLGNPKAPDIMEDLRFLRKNGIRMHAQIVLCPGYNDGPALEKTVRDLGRFYPHLMSIAVVPVGLTEHRRIPLKPVDKQDALKTIGIIEAFQSKFSRKHADLIVYGSDELYIKAGLPFPPLMDYGDLPQIENGVGMLPLFLAEAKKLKPSPLKGKYLTFTGASFYPYLKKFLKKLEKYGMDITPVKVENAFFGKSVTVAGLLTGKDIIRAIKQHISDSAIVPDAVLVPDVTLREGGDVFLDDLTVKDMQKALKVRVIVVESTPAGIINIHKE